MAAGLKSHPTPHTPPQGPDPLSWLCLIRSRRVGPATFFRLLAEHGSAEAALAALPDVARAAGVENYEAYPIALAERELARGRALGASLLLHGARGYPGALMDLPDAPPVLWALGDLTLLNRDGVALVGARNASSLGLRMARRLAEGLGAAGQVVISGLARGVDAEAHEAALDTGTVAVMAGGVDIVYPEENADLAARIAAKGCRISEQPLGLEPQSRHFPQRNRLISGLSRAVIVVEAAARSGSLITARTALDQGREVFAVPGHPFDARASGCNMLIRDGATLIRGAEDVLEALGVAPAPRQGQPEGAAAAVLGRAALKAVEVPGLAGPLPGPVPERRGLAETASLHARILSRLGPSPLAEDQLIRDLALPPSVLAPALVSLELEGEIERQAGGLLSRRG